MAKRRTKASDVAKVTRAIAGRRNPDALPSNTKANGAIHEDDLVTDISGDAAREGI
jgi:hypothetical protein